MESRLPPSVPAVPVPEGVELDHPSLYFNRELSWLDFNRRVLQQVFDPGHPLLERVRFLGISASNLDEFVQKRLGGLRRLEAAGVRQRSADGQRPSEQLPPLRESIHALSSAIHEAWMTQIKPLLEAEAGMRFSRMSTLPEPTRTRLTSFFREHLYPILTPLAVDPGHPFPFISNLSLSLAIQMRDPREQTLHFARVKVPTRHGRWIPVEPSAKGHHFVPIEELVRHCIGELFPGMEIVGAWAFRVTRNADIRRDEEEAEDLIEMIAEELRERRLAPVVRLEVEEAMPSQIQELLLRELEIGTEDLVRVIGELALEDCVELANLDVPEHQFEPWDPIVPPRVGPVGDAGDPPSIFSVLRRGDLLVHHPYESFAGTVQRMVEEAAEDPAVIAIKQTLYRTSDNSPIVRALLRAADLGKQVAVLVEVKARFDEQNNIEWGRILEDAGVHVTYGLVGLKTHAKALLVIREEEGHPRTYVHIGTGNYHIGNARIYTDLGLLTADAEIGHDVVNLFHFLTGYAPAQPYRRLIVAPAAMRNAFAELIEREIEFQESGSLGRIVAKMNALDDPEVIRQLYRASRAGVRVELIIRGHCALRPGLSGYSENIRVISLIGRFLEHDRIFLFGNGGDPALYMGSADWRSRNLDRRVEAVVPIDEPGLRTRLIEILEWALEDNDLAWELDGDGFYDRLAPRDGEARLNLHERLMQVTRDRRLSVAVEGDAP